MPQTCPGEREMDFARPTKKMPTLNEVIRLIAQRGGFLARKGDGEPGAKTLWLGLQEIAIFVEGARYAREFSEVGTCVKWDAPKRIHTH